MLDGEFCREVENSSNSTRNSRDMKILKKLILESDEKLRFFRNDKSSRDSKSIAKNADGADTLAKKTHESPTVLSLARLPLVEKKDFIENWIRSNEANFLQLLPQKSSPLSSVSPNKPQKRLSDSPLSSCVGKRKRIQNSEFTLSSKSKTKENRQLERNHRVRDETLLENDACGLESSPLTSYSSNRPEQKFLPRPNPGDPNLVIGRVRNSEILAPSSPVLVDSKTDRYSCNGRNFSGTIILESSGNWGESLGRPSSSTLREESPLRWTGYERPTVGSKKEKYPSRESKSFSSNVCLLRENNWRKLSPESPLRWNGYEIRDSSPSSSILLGTSSQGEDRLNRKEIIYSPASSRNVNKILADSEAESPLRCVEYQPEIRDLHKLAPSQTLSSPMNEAERIIEPSSSSESDEILIFEDENSSGEGNSRKSRITRKKCNFQAETPRRLSGCKFMEFCKLPEVSLSMSDPELASLLTAMPGQEEPILDPGSEKSSGNLRLMRKTRPIKLETIFASEIEEIVIPSLTEPPETRAVSTAMPETERIEVESLKVSVTEEDSKIDVESETGSDRTIGNDIEDVFTQNCVVSMNKEKTNFSPRNIDPEESDSDATYFSDGEPARNEAPEDKFSPEAPRIARDFSIISKNKSEIISEASSPKLNHEENTMISVPTIPPPKTTNKRTKKAKQGSLAARLQYLVNFQISDRQIWRYRKTRTDWQDSRAQFVKLRIREGEMRYSRCFLLGSRIEDENKLLDDLCACGEGRGSDEGTVRLMIVPEINGTMKISKNSIMKIYPPWKIMDRGNKLLSVIYFEVLAQDEKSSVHPRRSVEREQILQTFDCPCLKNQAIDHSCTVKFTNTKPNVIREMFFDSK